MKRVLSWITAGLGIVSLAGCARITSQVVEKPRVDQELAGNQGYLKGDAPKTAERKTTRKIIQTDIELPTGDELNPWKGRKTGPQAVASAIPAVKAETPKASVVAPPVTSVEEVFEEEAEDFSAPPARPARSVPQQMSPKPEAAASTYTVKPGDTLEKIAAKVYSNGSHWRTIYQANRNVLKSPNRIYAGQKLVIPPLKEAKRKASAGWGEDLK